MELVGAMQLGLKTMVVKGKHNGCKGENFVGWLVLAVGLVNGVD